MFQRLGRLSVFAAVVLLLSGCIETTQIITVNPDGKGKVAYEVLIASAPAMDPLGGPGGGGKEKTLEETRKEAAANLLTKSKGVTAWKDVSVKWAPDGRLQILGTAYFDRLDDLTGGGGIAGAGGGGIAGAGGGNDGLMLSIINFQIGIEKDKLTIVSKKNDPNPAPKAAPVDVAKLAERELDEYILKQRVGYQATKPLLVMMFTDMKVKTVFRLPGEALVSKGFKLERDGFVHNIDGNEILKGYKQFMAQDNVAMKKALKTGNPNVMELFGMSEDMMEPSLTVHKLGKPMFDYAKEIQAARDAYPQLRQLFSVPAEMKLPGEK